MPGEESRQHGGDDEGNGCRQDVEADLPGHFSRLGGRRFERLERLTHRRTGLFEKTPSGSGERNAASGAREQRHAELCFQLTDGLAERGRRDPQLGRGGGKAAPPRHHKEFVQGIEGCEGHSEDLLHSTFILFRGIDLRRHASIPANRRSR